MEYALFIGIILIVFVLLIINGIRENKKRKARLLRSLRENYGKPCNREWKTEEFEQVSHYAEKRKTKDSIDDLTWNDLDMDEIFKQMAYTQSSIGDGYLYYLLRNPKVREEELLRMEERISYFQRETEDRVSMQMLLHEVGRTGKYALADYLDYLVELPRKSNLKHYLADALLLAAIPLMFFQVGYGLTAFFVILTFNIMTYFKEKAQIDPYLTSFRYIFHLIHGGESVSRQAPEVLREEAEALEAAVKQFDRFRRNSFILMPFGGELELFLDYLRMCLHLDLIKFNRMLSELQNHIEEIDTMMELIGGIDAEIAIGAYRSFLPQFTLPLFTTPEREGGCKLRIAAGYHPLIKNAVPNSFCMEKNILLTGSNASGKSTFLKMAALNILLAQTIHTCPAAEYEGNMYHLLSSMSIKDSMLTGESYYMVEIRAVKRILEKARESQIPVFCMIDEVLKGTNTIERIAAASQILQGMAERGICCMAATHDIELTSILERSYDNYHFEELVKDGDIYFLYELKKGKAVSRNALRLLQNMGYEETLVERAEAMAKEFTEQGEWRRL